MSLDLIAHYTGVPKHEIDYRSAGINHMAWFVHLQHRGRDLYPLLRGRFEDPAYYASEKVRVAARFGQLAKAGERAEGLPASHEKSGM